MNTTIQIARLTVFEEMVRAAIHAPSADNNQPWQFVADGERLAVFLDRARALPSDVNGMFDLTALGAAIENACLAARKLGYIPNVRYDDSNKGTAPFFTAPSPDSKLIATIDLVAGDASDSLVDWVTQRCTCRKLYSTRPVGAETLDQLAGETSGIDDVRLDWLSDRSQIRTFARLVATSDRFRFQYEPFHAELYRQLRFTVDEVERSGDGLDVRTLELPPGGAAVLRWLGNWNRMRQLSRWGLDRLLTIPSAQAVWRSGAVGILSVGESTAEAFIRGGRVFQRIWLRATAEGLAMHPLGSLPIFLAHLQQYEGQDLRDKDRILTARLGAELHRLTAGTQDRIIQIVFRVGYGPQQTERSRRRPAGDVFQSVES